MTEGRIMIMLWGGISKNRKRKIVVVIEVDW